MLESLAWSRLSTMSMGFVLEVVYFGAVRRGRDLTIPREPLWLGAYAIVAVDNFLRNCKDLLEEATAVER